MVYRISSVSCLADGQEGANHSMWLLTQTRPALEAWDSKHLILELWSHESDQPDPLGKQAHKATGVSASGGVSTCATSQDNELPVMGYSRILDLITGPRSDARDGSLSFHSFSLYTILHLSVIRC